MERTAVCMYTSQYTRRVKVPKEESLLSKKKVEAAREYVQCLTEINKTHNHVLLRSPVELPVQRLYVVFVH